MSSLNKGITKVEVALRWDPSPLGQARHDLDVVAAAYPSPDGAGIPAYLVHSNSRSPDGTITLNRESGTGQGLGFDEVMTLELDRLAERYTRVVVGVAIQQREGHITFADVANPEIRFAEGHEELAAYDFAALPEYTAATVGEFTRDSSGAWRFRMAVRGFDADPQTFGRLMGEA